MTSTLPRRVILFGLPVRQSLMLPTHRGEPPNPEHTGALDILHRQMVENDSGLTPHLMCVKRIRHDQKDVNVLGVGVAVTKEPNTANLITCPVLTASV